MIKHGFYGLYNNKGGGVYDNWAAVLRNDKYYPYRHLKKFATWDEAVDFVVDGLSEIMDRSSIDVDKLYSRTNWFFRLVELRKGYVPQADQFIRKTAAAETKKEESVRMVNVTQTVDTDFGHFDESRDILEKVPTKKDILVRVPKSVKKQ